MGHERRGSESSSGVLPFGLLHVHSNKRKPEGDAAMHDARVVQTIAVSDRGFALEARGQGVVEASWSDVRRVVAYKHDALTTDIVVFEIALDPAGECWTVNEEMGGFPELAAAMETALPGFRRGWQEVVINPGFARNETVLYDRG